MTKIFPDIYLSCWRNQIRRGWEATMMCITPRTFCQPIYAMSPLQCSSNHCHCLGMAFALPACQWCIKFTLACFTWVSFFLYSQGSFMGDVWDGIFCSLALRKVLCSLAEEKQQPCRMLATYPLVSYKLIFAGPSRTLSNPDSTRAQWGKGEKTHLFSRIMD